MENPEKETVTRRKRIMINDEIAGMLVDQIKMFQYAANLYQTFGLWAKDEGLIGCGDYLFKQAKERRHSAKYLHEQLDTLGGVWNTVAVAEASPDRSIETVVDLFDLALEEEIKITNSLNNICTEIHGQHQWIVLPYVLEMLEFQIGEEDEARDHLTIAKASKDIIVVDIKVATILKAKKKD